MNRSPWIACAVLFAIVSGCGGDGGKEILMRKSCLSKLGMSYHGFYAKHGKSPASVEELASYVSEQGSADDPINGEAVKRLREGDIVMIYDGVLGDGESNEQYVLGFEAGVPGSGGYIVTAGGFVDHVTAKEFSQMNEIPVASAGATGSR